MSSEPNKSGLSGPEDSWEGLAEDLFGIDFSSDGISETPVLSDEVIAEVIADESAADSEALPDVGTETDATAEVEAGQSDSADPTDNAESQSDDSVTAEAVAEETAADNAESQSNDPERDNYWNALEDWDWDDKPDSGRRSDSGRRAGKRPTSRQSDRSTARSVIKDDPPVQPAATESSDASAASFQDEFVEDTAFGVGVLDTVDFGSTSSDSDAAQEPQPEDEAQTEVQEEVSDVPSVREDSKTETHTQEQEAEEGQGETGPGDADGTAEADEDADSESPPRKRRRRRRRRRPKSDDAGDDATTGDDATAGDDTPQADARPVTEVSASEGESADGFGVFVDDVAEKKPPAAEKRSPRRRSRRRRGRREKSSEVESELTAVSTTPQDAETEFTDPSGNGDGRELNSEGGTPQPEHDSVEATAYRDLPTWEEAISYLLDPSLVEGAASESDSGKRTSSKRGPSNGGKSSGRRGRRKK